MATRRVPVLTPEASARAERRSTRRQRVLAWLLVGILLVSTLGTLVTLFAR